MRLVLLCLVTLALAAAPRAQAPDTTATPLLLDTQRTPKPVGVQMLTGSLGATVGLAGGVYVGVSTGNLSTAVVGAAAGTLLGATFGVQATGRTDRFWETFGGAALGTLAGIAVVSALGEDALGGAAGWAVPIGAGVGAALANSAGGD